MKRYIVVDGKHHIPTREGKEVTTKVFVKGDIVRSDSDLTKKFPGQFRVYQEVVSDNEPESPPTPAAEAEVESSEGAPTEKEEAAEETPLGEEVTDQFPGADGKDARVFKDGLKFSVTNRANPAEALHEGTLTKKQVPAFLKELESIPEE